MQSILSPEADVRNTELGDLIDVQAVQSLMDDFYSLARIPMSLIDLKGRLLVGVGWQEICTRFHRVNPETFQKCLESDLRLSEGIPPGKFRLYRCKNNMWDLATPVVVRGQHIGNVFSGQFFLDDEPLNYDLFRSQARLYGFNEEEYIASLQAVPRISRESLNAGVNFLLKLAHMLSELGQTNIQLARSLSERDALTASLKQSGERLNRAEKIAHLGSWELDLTNNRLSWSDEVYRIFGLQPQEFGASYEAFLEAVHPEDRAAVDDAYSSSVREGKSSYEMEHRIVRKATGEVRWVHEKCEHTREDSGRIIRSCGMVLDITERKRAEEALLASQEALQKSHAELEKRVQNRTAELSRVNRELSGEVLERKKVGEALKAERQRLNDAMEMLPVYVALLTPDYHVPFANRTFRERFGEPRGRRCFEFLFDRTAPCDDCQTYKALKTNAPHEWRWTGPDGRNYEIFDFPFTDSDGTTVVMEMGIDVTERKLAEDELRSANQELEQRTSQLRALAAELAQAEDRERRRLAQVLHDHLQQLLVAAKFSIGAVLMKDASESSRPNLERVRRLLDQSIEVSRSLTAELAPPVLYEQNFSDALRWLGRWMDDKHHLAVRVRVDGEEDGLPQDARVVLFQVVRELLFNTAKHAQVGHAEVNMDRLPDGSIQVTVTDEGVGFDPSMTSPADRSEGGFGLLSIRERMAAMGGTLRIDSVPGLGTKAAVWLPARVLSSTGVEKVLSQSFNCEPVCPQVSAAGPIRVLLADDHEIVRVGLAQLLLEVPDVQIVGQAADGLEAIQMSKTLQPHVIIMDISMPGMSGLEATRQIKAEMPDCRIIGLSMHPASDMEAAMRAAGAAAYLDKTGAGEVLINTVQVLGRQTRDPGLKGQATATLDSTRPATLVRVGTGN